MSKFRALPFAALIFGVLLSSCTDRSDRNEIKSLNSDLPTTSPSPTSSSENVNEKKLDFDKFAEQQKLPRSEDYPVPKGEMFSGTPAKPILSEKRAQNYRTLLREGAERGPNFAGHYTFVAWGAGMGNFSFAVIDAKTGKIYFAPFESVSRASFGLSFDDEPEANPAFRIESKLFAFCGCPGKEYEGCSDWDKDGFYLYSFNNGRFKLVRFVKRERVEAAMKE